MSGGKNLTTSWTASTACEGCFEADLSGQVEQVPGLRRNDIREIRARFPNFDPELDSTRTAFGDWSPNHWCAKRPPFP